MKIKALNLLPKKLRFFSISSLLLLGLLATTPVFAANDVPPPPAMEGIDPDLPLPEAEVTIIRKKETVIEEYRVNGKLRYAKITPTKGKPYYLYDSTGDGVLDTKHSDLDNPPIQRWILFEW